jgi:hypothetical protein
VCVPPAVAIPGTHITKDDVQRSIDVTMKNKTMQDF